MECHNVFYESRKNVRGQIIDCDLDFPTFLYIDIRLGTFGLKRNRTVHSII